MLSEKSKENIAKAIAIEMPNYISDDCDLSYELYSLLFEFSSSILVKNFGRDIDQNLKSELCNKIVQNLYLGVKSDGSF